MLIGREMKGSIDKRSAVPAELCGRIQLFCRTLGHLSPVYCVMFDKTGQYIFTVGLIFLNINVGKYTLQFNRGLTITL